ncbi:MAG: hypothetical protein FWF73_07625 [Spirochaetes bacterium]|nr:hypothetical protein [Spirochaetota bacterium]
MKKIKIFAVIITLFTAVSAYAEYEARYNKKQSPNVLFDINFDDLSPYWGLNSRYSFSDSKTWLGGARAGLLIDHNFAIGLGAMGVIHFKDTEKLLNAPYDSYYNKTRLYYGGMTLAYYFNPKDLIIFSVGSLIGGGLLHFDKNKSVIILNDVNDKFFVVEPEINVFLNIIPYCRIGVGSSYRFTKGLNTNGLNKDFRDFTVSASIEIGVF